ncbi:MAG TPA: (2Fe-2S) ferredoxin domain-containing protein [Kofleriaceae bacterium]|jgi:NADH:ubiquinone oxidoreductase subunit E
MTKVPTRSPTHEDVELGRLASMGLELEEIAADDVVQLADLIELAEDRGRPASHYVAAIALATELTIAPRASAIALKICAGNCQRYGALDLIDALIAKQANVTWQPVDCLDRCDNAPACELHGAHGVLVIAPATTDAIAEALNTL